ncbi:MAG: tyrosine--tRNA ligase [Candidatus Aenigmatarchaeota archaeon]
MDEKISLITREPTIEVLTLDRLKELLEKGEKLRHYIGFEISGFVHLGTGLICMNKVADFQKAGIETNIFLADYHSWINKKLGGDIELIRKIGSGYFKEALKISLKCVGGDPDKAKFIFGYELYEKLGIEFFTKVLKISMNLTLARAKRGLTILGRKQKENITLAQLIYIPMQVADIFSLNVNIAHGGLDQRKAHVIALEVCEEFGYKPIAIHHRLLTGLHIDENIRKKLLEAKNKGDRELFEEGIIDIKMSKSKPSSAIFIHDTEEEIKNKIMKAYCPPKEIELNPVFEIAELIIFPYLIKNNREFEIKNLKTGELRKYNSINHFKEEYISGKIHPLDLKNSVSEYLIELLEPARKYFLDGPGKKYLEELKSLIITR